MNHRIIARLDIKGPNLVKGIHLEGLRVLGKPEEYARAYYQAGADELIFQDVVASLYERNSLHDIISRTAREIFIPLTVGGGLRSIDDIRNVLRAGADKVSINTAAIRNPQLIREASRVFGSSTIVVAIEAIKQTNGRYQAFIDNGREHTGVEVLEWAIEVERLGAGEIVLTSVDREGSGEGYDLELIAMVAKAVSIPVIAHGGPGRLDDVRDAIKTGGADAVAVASMLHYHELNRQQSESSFASEGNTEFLRSGRQSSKIATTTLPTLKRFLHESGVPCRQVADTAATLRPPSAASSPDQSQQQPASAGRDNAVPATCATRGSGSSRPRVAIIDYRMGNMFSVQHACEAVGLDAKITEDPAEIMAADGAILPGVGAFGDAMKNMRELGLDRVVYDYIASGRPFMGICLGMQLLFAESEEFGSHQGLGVFPGRVLKFPATTNDGRPIKVPQIGWNQIRPSQKQGWAGTVLADVQPDEYMYFVHSFYCAPDDPSVALTLTDYEGFTYCSSVHRGNVVASQYHPEKSAFEGMKIYENWAKLLTRRA